MGMTAEGFSDHITRYFPRRKREWAALMAALGEGENALQHIGNEDAEFLRLVFGIERAQFSLADAGKRAYSGRDVPPRWIYTVIGRLALAVGESRLAPLCALCATGALVFDHTAPPRGAIELTPCTAKKRHHYHVIP